VWRFYDQTIYEFDIICHFVAPLVSLLLG
jgi:hypothetical protein